MSAADLQALKVGVLGPPGSGKSFLAEQLCQHYKLPRVHVQGVITATLDRLNGAIAALEGTEVNLLVLRVAWQLTHSSQRK
jgi:Ni2+-binding GTPase involved in maturation of urease and hydrogenase